MTRFRTEHDTMGAVRVPADALWGAQTARAGENFPVSGLKADPALIRSYILLKKSAAVANHVTGGELPARLARAIVSACDEVLGDGAIPFRNLVAFASGRPEGRKRSDPIRRPLQETGAADSEVSDELRGQFVVDIFQAGAGTSFNMNCNEVVANLANRSLGGRLGKWSPIHPNDHVNMSQSTNDTFPTATRLAVLLVAPSLAWSLRQLSAELMRKARAFDSVVKSGRTHLQDAVPVTLGQEFRAWARAVDRAARLFVEATDELRELGIGGTATGTGINTPVGYRAAMIRLLSELTGLELTAMRDMREGMQSQLPVAAVSASLRNLALELGRISNDLRLLSSGPTTGFAEIKLPPVQPGSSIMPGKVNPSMPECLNQICFRVIGADATVSSAVGAGQLELNVMMPVMAAEVLFSMRILASFLPVFAAKCIAGIEADRDRCRTYLERSPALATFLNPIIGYERAAEIAKESVATGRSIVEILREKAIVPDKELKRLFGKENLTGRARE